MSTKKLSVSPSGISFALGDASVSDYNRSCLRYTLVQRNTYARSEIPAIYTALGELDEHRFQHHLEALGLRDIEFQPYFEFPYRDITIRGYMDFKGVDDEGKVVVEKKSTISTSTRGKMRKGIPTVDHIAQLSLYMGVEKAKKGYLVQSFYEFDYRATSLICTEEIKYTVQFADNGIILVNGKPFQYSTKDLASWLTNANEVLTKSKISSRPVERIVCASCPLNNLCDRVDSNQIFVEEFIQEGGEAIRASINTRNPQIFKPKRERKQLRLTRYTKGESK